MKSRWSQRRVCRGFLWRRTLRACIGWKRRTRTPIPIPRPQRSQRVQRSSQTLESAIAGDYVEVKRRPIGQHHCFAALPIIGFDIALTCLAIIDPEPVLSLDCHGCEPMIVFVLTERAARSPVTPSSLAVSAGEQTETPWVHADQLGHRRWRSTSGAVTA